MFKRTLVCALLATGLMLGTAHAGPLTGIFTIDIYHGYGGGLSTSPGVQANLDNPLLSPDYFLDQVIYTGEIDFKLAGGGDNTIGAFLASGGGTVAGGLSSATGSHLLSAGSFGATTVFNITAWTGTGLAGSIVHDDGIGLYHDGLLVTPVGATAPTSPVSTPFELAPGNFQLIYVAANNLPEQLSIDAIGTVPDGGATLSLLGFALVGLGLLRRKFSA